MSAIDSEGRHLAVAGRRGFTIFSFVTRKWKIFGNADQEKEFRVTGGLIWWKEYVLLSCYNFNEQKDEVI
jgi:RAB6A-GEF complex partner protein 1